MQSIVEDPTTPTGRALAALSAPSRPRWSADPR
jgi:hypothetical protein